MAPWVRLQESINTLQSFTCSSQLLKMWYSRPRWQWDQQNIKPSFTPALPVKKEKIRGKIDQRSQCGRYDLLQNFSLKHLSTNHGKYKGKVTKKQRRNRKKKGGISSSRQTSHDQSMWGYHAGLHEQECEQFVQDHPDRDPTDPLKVQKLTNNGVCGEDPRSWWFRLPQRNLIITEAKSDPNKSEQVQSSQGILLLSPADQ